jgi:Ca-activated chloride channel family protein
LARRYINDKTLPPPEAIRLEEFVNYFHQGFPIPSAEDVFSIHLEAAPTPFNAANNYVLRVGIQGYQVDPDQRADANLVFVIDVSGSMDREERLEAVKLALYDLVNELRPEDQVGIVIYSTEAYVLLEPTPVQDTDKIKEAIAILHPLETTNVEAGLRLGYKMATENYNPERINRIILCSDGVANVDETDPRDILPLVRGKAQDGIVLTSVGFGLGNYNDVLMEQLADEGDGQYYYVDSYPEARRIFVERLTSTLVAIARDAKIQVVFNPSTVAHYRLMGYENRDIPDVDFRDDSVDAGEINSGHSVTALYEIVPTDPNTQGEIATVHLRWADPDSGAVREIRQAIQIQERAASFPNASAYFQLNVVVVAFADLLGEGAWVQHVTWPALRDMADIMANADAFSNDPDVVEFAELVRRAAPLAP